MPRREEIQPIRKTCSWRISEGWILLPMASSLPIRSLPIHPIKNSEKKDMHPLIREKERILRKENWDWKICGPLLLQMANPNRPAENRSGWRILLTNIFKAVLDYQLWIMSYEL